MTMKTLLASTIVILGLMSTSVGLSAHHSWPVSYEKLVTVKGTVKEISWMNPHPMFKVDVKANDGKTETWEIGGPAINRMEAATTVKVGDVITGTGYQFSDGQKIVRLERVVLADGKELRVYGR
jgi:hypothetical protein